MQVQSTFQCPICALDSSTILLVLGLSHGTDVYGLPLIKLLWPIHNGITLDAINIIIGHTET